MNEQRAAAILAERTDQETRVVVEGGAARREFVHAMYSARQVLATPKVLVDENGVEFTVGASVTTLRDLYWTDATGTAGLKRTVAGARGEIVRLDDRLCGVQLDGREQPYLFRLDMLVITLRVVG